MQRPPARVHTKAAQVSPRSHRRAGQTYMNTQSEVLPCAATRLEAATLYIHSIAAFKRQASVALNFSKTSLTFVTISSVEKPLLVSHPTDRTSMSGLCTSLNRLFVRNCAAAYCVEDTALGFVTQGFVMQSCVVMMLGITRSIPFVWCRFILESAFQLTSSPP